MEIALSRLTPRNGEDSHSRLRFPGSVLSRVAGIQVVERPDGAVSVAVETRGLALFGPYTTAEDGIYEVRIDAHSQGVGFYVEVFDPKNDCRIFASRQSTAPVVFIVRLYATNSLEFRFGASGQAFTVECVTLKPILLDKEPASKDQLKALLSQFKTTGAEPNALFRVIDRLAAVGEKEAAKAERAGFISSHDAARSAIRSELIAMQTRDWASRPSQNPAGGFDHATVVAVCEEIEISSKNLLSMDQNDRLWLRRRGYLPRHLEATRFYRNLDEPARTWSEAHLQGGREGQFFPRNPLFERQPDIDRSYQYEVLSGKGVTAFCPVSGEEIKSHHGFLLHFCDLPFIMYRFEGTEVFYMCVGHISGARLFLYMPRTQTVIWICDPWFHNYPAQQLVLWLNVNLVMSTAMVGTYLRNSTRPAIVAGNNIIGHYLWHTLSGIEWAINADLLSEVNDVVGVAQTYLDPAIIFPELASCRYAQFMPYGPSFEYFVSERLLPVHLTDVRMDEGVVDRLRTTATRNATSRGKVPGDLQRPFIWINLRSHSKVWTNQVVGYAEILNAIRAEYGQATVFFDGMIDCATILADIRVRLHPGIIVYDGLRPPQDDGAHLTLYDMINWLPAMDAYICPISSGMVFAYQVGGKSGVLHAEHAHLEQMSWTSSMGPNLHEPFVVSKEDVKDLGQGLYGDYDLDWRVLLDLLRQALAQSGQRSR